MRIILFFDLPMTTSAQLKAYRTFRKGLIGLGFLMLQESVYTKIALNASIVHSIRKKIERIKPAEGSVLILSVTEKQFARMETLVGERRMSITDTDERLLII